MNDLSFCGTASRLSSPSSLRITDLRVAHIDGVPKHCILLRIDTSEGISGYGELRDASSATYALMCKSRLVGENPLHVEKLFRRIRQFGGHSRQGGGVSGIEIALWDIVGKVWGVPLWQLLGGRYRDRVRVYCDTDVEGRHTGTEMGRALRRRMEEGFTFLKMDLGIELLLDEPGCLCAPAGMLEEMRTCSPKALSHQRGSVDRATMRGKNYEVFTIPHHTTGISITRRGLDVLEDYVRQVREEIGYGIPLAIDHIGHIPQGDIVRLAQRLEEYNIAWLEDPTPWQLTDRLKYIQSHTTVPVCTGEDIFLAENFAPLLHEGAISVAHPDLLTVGGCMELKKLSALCEESGTAMALHMAGSPVGFLAAVHTAAALPHMLALEYHSADCPLWAQLVKGLPDPLIRDGFVAVPDAPGLGIEALNEPVLRAHLHPDFPELFGDTSAWNNDWSNDRTWS